MVPAAGKLAKFLKDNGIAIRRAARDLKVSAPTLLNWIEGRFVPSGPRQAAIRVYTRGEVGEPDWRTDADRELEAKLAEVQPFVPEPAPEPEPPPESTRSETKGSAA